MGEKGNKCQIISPKSSQPAAPVGDSLLGEGRVGGREKKETVKSLDRMFNLQQCRHTFVHWHLGNINTSLTYIGIHYKQ